MGSLVVICASSLYELVYITPHMYVIRSVNVHTGREAHSRNAMWKWLQATPHSGKWSIACLCRGFGTKPDILYIYIYIYIIYHISYIHIYILYILYIHILITYCHNSVHEHANIEAHSIYTIVNPMQLTNMQHANRAISLFYLDLLAFGWFDGLCIALNRAIKKQICIINMLRFASLFGLLFLWLGLGAGIWDVMRLRLDDAHEFLWKLVAHNSCTAFGKKSTWLKSAIGVVPERAVQRENACENVDVHLMLFKLFRQEIKRRHVFVNLGIRDEPHRANQWEYMCINGPNVSVWRGTCFLYDWYRWLDGCVCIPNTIVQYVHVS